MVHRRIAWLLVCALSACLAAIPLEASGQTQSGAAAPQIIDPHVRQAAHHSTPQVLTDYTRGVTPPAILPASQPAETVSIASAPTAPAAPPAAAASTFPALQPRKQTSILLSPPGEPGKAKASSAAPLLTTMASLGAVLALFFAVVWVMRRGMPNSQTLLPPEVVETLGRAPLPGRQQMQLIRCGAKLLLVCVSPAGAETLTEITDPAEVDRLSGLCREAHPHSATAAFRQVLQQFGRERAPLGFAGDSRHEAEQLTAMPVMRRGRAPEDDDV